MAIVRFRYVLHRHDSAPIHASGFNRHPFPTLVHLNGWFPVFQVLMLNHLKFGTIRSCRGKKSISQQEKHLFSNSRSHPEPDSTRAGQSMRPTEVVASGSKRAGSTGSPLLFLLPVSGPEKEKGVVEQKGNEEERTYLEHWRPKKVFTDPLEKSHLL